jgi:hypothetical protein
MNTRHRAYPNDRFVMRPSDAYSIFSLESCVLSLWSMRSTTVENPLQINPFYAKQTQF